MSACIGSKRVKATYVKLVRQQSQCPGANVTKLTRSGRASLGPVDGSHLYRAEGCGRSTDFVCRGRRKIHCVPLPMDEVQYLTFRSCGPGDPPPDFDLTLVDRPEPGVSYYLMLGCSAGPTNPHPYRCLSGKPVAACTEIITEPLDSQLRSGSYEPVNPPPPRGGG